MASNTSPSTLPEDDVDEYEARIARTGCAELNERVLLCYADHRDWRKCAPEVKAFRECFEAHQRRLEAKHKGGQ